jgi:hypothetical protein
LAGFSYFLNSKEANIGRDEENVIPFPQAEEKKEVTEMAYRLAEAFSIYLIHATCPK